MNLLDIKNLNIDFPLRRYTHHATTDVFFSISKGEIVGIVGESGAGKSTIGNAVIDLLSRPGKVVSGEIFLEGREISNLSYDEMLEIRGGEIGFIFQDPMTSLNPLFTIGDQLIETMVENLNISTEKAKQKAIVLLEQVGIDNPETRLKQYPHQFSGGMRQRVVIAIALSCDPKLIIADEPTTALDVSVQDQILQLIKKLCTERDVGVMLVTHDMGVIANVADRVVVMYKGKIVEIGATDQVLTRPIHEYTKSLISAVPPSKKKLDRFPNITYIEKNEENLPSIDVKNHWLGKTQASSNSKYLLEVKNVSLKFKIKDSFLKKNRQYIYANKDVSFNLSPGESLGLVGESGSGKSTIARTIVGLYKPECGQIYYDGINIGEMSEKQRNPLRSHMQMIFQNPYSSLNPRMSVNDTICEPMRLHKLAPSNQIAQITRDLLNHVGLGEKAADKYPHEFSGGQRQRISIARALATRPKLLICDEPTSALDVSVQAQILNLIKDLQDELGLSILFITHDLPVVRQMCDRIAVMRSGKILEVSNTDDLFNNPKHPYTAQLLDLIPALDKVARRS